jgi:hypothetical protein
MHIHSDTIVDNLKPLFENSVGDYNSSIISDTTKKLTFHELLVDGNNITNTRNNINVPLSDILYSLKDFPTNVRAEYNTFKKHTNLIIYLNY